MGTIPMVTFLKTDSYLARIHGALGTHMFRRLYAIVDGKKKDITLSGALSCSLFVSSILVQFALIQRVHATVAGTTRDMRASGWKRIRRPRIGCVVVWHPDPDERGMCHEHIGFYVGKGKAISNSTKKRSPSLHPYKRHQVKELYWNKELE